MTLLIKLGFFIVAAAARLTRFDYLIVSAHYLKNRMLRSQGVSIGARTLIYGCKFTSSSAGDKFVIGKDCTLTGATFIGHDASPTLYIEELNSDKNPVLPGARKSIAKIIVVGDRVFIGHGSIILPGVCIGSDVIVGAGSVVTKDLKSGYVYAGNPARRIIEIEKFVNEQRLQLGLPLK